MLPPDDERPARGRATSCSSSATTGRRTSSFQCSDNTWQAYNRWPDNYSVYTHPKGNQGPWADVSFDRPYGREAQYLGVVNDPLTVGSGEFLPLRVPAGLFPRTARLRRDLLRQQRHDQPGPRAEVQGVHQRRPRRVLGHPAVRERR